MPALLVVLIGVAALAVDGGSRPSPAAGSNDAPGRYLVMLQPGLNPFEAADELGRRYSFDAHVVYRHALSGFAAQMTARDAAELAADPSVALVEPDRIMSATLHTNPFQTLPEGVDRIDAELNAAAGIGGPAGPDLNIDVAVIDTGVQTDHPEITVAGGARFIGITCASGSYADDNGHGTHVAGTIAAKDNSIGVVGVAPGARIWAVKVLDASGNGYTSCVTQGVDWVTGRRQEYNDGAADGDPGVNIAVANMSIGGGNSTSLCTAIANSANAGVMYAVAAGNEGVNASNSSPANCSSAVTVSAYADFDGDPGGLLDQTLIFQNCTETEDDSFACFSNFGNVVDIAAPGVNIVSTAPGGLYAWMSGTSMASPHVAGGLALFKVATGYSGSAQASSVMSALTSVGWTRAQNSACGFTGDPDGVSEPLLYLGSGCGGGGPTPSPSPSATASPTASPTPTPSPAPTASPSPTPSPSPNCPQDSDCDGWSNALETAIGTLTLLACPASSTPDDEQVDAWPPDFNDDRNVGITDVLTFGPHMSSTTARWDLDASGSVNVTDIIEMKDSFATACG